MMGETFKYCAPIAGALGFSAEDTAEAIGLMANAGIKSTGRYRASYHHEQSDRRSKDFR